MSEHPKSPNDKPPHDRPNRVWCLQPKLDEVERDIVISDACGNPSKPGDSGFVTLSILRAAGRNVPGR